MQIFNTLTRQKDVFRSVRRIDVGIRMIFAAQFSICFFYFFIGCLFTDTQNLIRI